MAALTHYIHPLAMLSILEIYNHRPEGSDDVIGILIGTKKDGIITLHESHYIAHEVQGDDVRCDLQRVKSITDQAKASNSEYRVVGWFSTCTEIVTLHRIIHNHFAQEFDDPTLCLLTVDVTLRNDMVTQTLYIHKTIDVSKPFEVTNTALPAPGSPTDARLTVFNKVPLQTILPTQERIALHAILKGTIAGEEVDAPIALKSNADAVRDSLFGDLAANIAQSLNYVNGVINKDIQGDEEIGKKLLQVCANLPLFDQESTESFLSSSLDDLNLFVTLAQQTKQTISTAQFITQPQ